MVGGPAGLRTAGIFESSRRLPRASVTLRADGSGAPAGLRGVTAS